MSDKVLRNVLRNSHLVVGALLGAYVYVPSVNDSSAALWVCRLVVVPFLLLGGLWMWQQTRVGRWLGRSSTRTPEASR